ncbi:MAG: replicative DNA helicase [Planctomycetes bacterium]|nr:replicative DNA helicase [Planctomycetota bacterium]
MDTQPSIEERGVPRNLEAERSVLGALLLHCDAVNDVVQFLKPEDFYLPAHQVIYRAILDRHDRKTLADVITVEEELAGKGLLEEAGGRDRLLDLAGSVVSAAAVQQHAEIVREKAILRRLLETCLDLSRLAYQGGQEAQPLLDEAEQRIFEIARVGVRSDAMEISAILNETFQRIEMIRSREGRLSGLATTYYDLDDMTAGLQKGELVILAARPSMGKTSFALNICERVAGAGNGVLFFSLEMSAQQVIQNMLCCRAQIDSQSLRKGKITEQQYRRLQEEAGVLYNAPIFVDDTAGMTAQMIRAKARRILQRRPLSLIVIDYLQLLSSGRREESRQQEIAGISRGLKQLARELSVPVVALAQLNREVEGRDDHRPRMSDLRESGAIEQDADVIMLLHREEYYKRTEENAGLAQILIAKQRNGPTGDITLRFFREFMRFENYRRGAEPMT